MTIQLRRFLMLQLLCAFLSKAFGKLVMLIFLYIMLIVNSNKRFFCSLCANFFYFYNCVCLVPRHLQIYPSCFCCAEERMDPVHCFLCCCGLPALSTQFICVSSQGTHYLLVNFLVRLHEWSLFKFFFFFFFFVVAAHAHHCRYCVRKNGLVSQLFCFFYSSS
jgi:hypothetical protein